MDTINLRRLNTVLYKNNKATIMSISKLSVKLFNIDKQEYIHKWVDHKDIFGVPITEEIVDNIDFDLLQDMSIIKEDGVFVCVYGDKMLSPIFYLHQLENLLNAVYRDIKP